MSKIVNKLSAIRSALNIPVPKPISASIYDLIDLPNKKKLIPPLKLRRIIGQEVFFFENRVPTLYQSCQLKPNSVILDVGCGCGNIPISLILHSDFIGQYYGFDIVPQFIDWLKKNVSNNYPNYHFVHANIWNSSYNPNGKTLASEYKFSYPDCSFDIVFLGSIFTHLLPKDLENYFSEIIRVLKPGGVFYATYFLLYPKRKDKANNLRMKFFDTSKGYSVADFNIPENAVAYPREYILGLYDIHDLTLSKPVMYGFQDVIIAQKNCARIQ